MTSSALAGPGAKRAHQRHASMALALVVASALVTPLGWRALNAAIAEGATLDLGYLPSLALRRQHDPFDTVAIDNLRHGQPAWVFIGDSMMGTRIDPIRLGELSSTGDELVAFLYHPATGPAWWYLAFKNHLVASGVRPRVVFVFFRDTNLTDTLFRLESLYGRGFGMDAVARDAEPELDAIVAARKGGLRARVHAAAVVTYQSDIATGWLEPGLRRWFVNSRFPDPSERRRFDRSLTERFDLANLRSDVAADLADANRSADFARDVPTSVLPLMVDLAKANGLQLCFVRVQRRPHGTTPPPQSANLQRYVTDLSQWLRQQGMLFHDDWGDAELPERIYADGDHIRDRRHYTEVFRRRLDTLFR